MGFFAVATLLLPVVAAVPLALDAPSAAKTLDLVTFEEGDKTNFKLYVCQGGQCVLNVAGLPLSECEAACVPRPSANYTCQGGQCVINSRGLPKAECDLVCGGPGPAPPPAPPAKPNIVQLADSVPDLSTLVEALKAGNLTGALSSPGPFTVFAPTNEAFSALPPTVLKSLLDPENILQLQAVLEYHVAAGPAVYSKQLTNHERIHTLEGQSVEITLLRRCRDCLPPSEGDVFVDRSRVVKADNAAFNGVVHIIDKVLQPLGPPPPSPTPGPSPGPGPTRCTGASVNLTADQCAAWGKFWDGAGGPNWGGSGQGCSKSDPCGTCRGAECGPKRASSDCSQSDSCDSSITRIELQSSHLVGTIPNAIGAFVDIETFIVGGNRLLNGSLPASMSAWKKLKIFDVRATKFNGALPALNYRAMTQCVVCGAAAFGRAGCTFNAFSCPFPQGVTDRCTKFNGDMEYQPITNADCYNTTALE